MEPSLDNRQLCILLDVLKEREDSDVLEETFRLIAEQSYFLGVVNFSKQPIVQKDGSLRLQPMTEIKFPMLVNGDKQTFYPAFTDYMELKKWDQNSDQGMALPFCIDDYVEILEQDPTVSGIVINAFNQSFIVYKEMLQHLLEVRKQNKPYDKRRTFLQDIALVKYFFGSDSMSNIKLAHRFRRELNFRELGGYRSSDGRHIKDGILFRSGAPGYMNEEERKHFEELGVKVIIDFRSLEESKEVPDPDFPNTTYIHMPAMKNPEGEDIDFSPAHIFKLLPKTPTKNIARGAIDRFYDLLIFHNSAYKEMFNLLLEEQVPMLFHCTAGKDRTGVAAILIMLALGVSEETIEKDYLLTNKYRSAKIKEVLDHYRLIHHFSKTLKIILTFSQGVLPHGCQYVFDRIKEKYDSYEDYFYHEYGLTKEDLDRLKDLCLE